MVVQSNCFRPLGGQGSRLFPWRTDPVGTPSCPTPPRLGARRALGRPDPPVVCSSLKLDKYIPGYALHEKGLHNQMVHWSADGTKSARGPADEPLVSRWATGGHVPPSVCIGTRLFVLPESRSKQLHSTVGGGQEGRVLPWRTDRSASRPAPPRPAAGRALGRPGPPGICPGFGFDK